MRLLQLSILFILFVSCGGDDNTETDGGGNTTEDAVGLIQNLKAASTEVGGELSLSWTNPDDARLMNVEIIYRPTNPVGGQSPKSITVEGKKGANDSYLLKNLDNGSYTITAMAVAKSGKRSLPVSAIASPLYSETVLQDYIKLADPYILYHNGVYYAYGTHAASGIQVYSSENLKAWRGYDNYWALHKDNSYGDKNFWAPEVYYRQSNQTFYMYYSAEEHICVATSKSPLGPFVQDVKESMRPTDKSIDSSLFVDDDGTPYIYFVRFTNGNVIYGAPLEDDWKNIKSGGSTKCIEVSEPWEKVQGTIAEGPSVFKRNGIYYMLYSANHYESQNYGVGYATATSPLGPWTKSTTNPILQKPQNLVGVGHGAMFYDKDGSMKYVFHAHFSTSEIGPRTLYVTDMNVSDNGVTMDPEAIIKPYIIK